MNTETTILTNTAPFGKYAEIYMLFVSFSN